MLPAHRAEAQVEAEFNAYPYLSESQFDADLTIVTAARFTERLSYFGFVNVGGLFHSGSTRFQTSDQNLRWSITERSPVDLAIQGVIRYGRSNDTFHAGIRWRLNDTIGIKSVLDAIHLDYAVQFFAVRLDQREVRGWQISNSYQLDFPYISDRLYFSGFLDYNIDERVSTGRRNVIISENQLGVRLFRSVHAVAEYRFNEYRSDHKHNVAVGLELKLDW